MTRVFNVYCDESCHLENDRQKAMVLGAVWCPMEKTREIAVRIREMKAGQGLFTWPHTKRKLQKEYEAYIKANAAS
jgi:hypothetical protein